MKARKGKGLLQQEVLVACRLRRAGKCLTADFPKREGRPWLLLFTQFCCRCCRHSTKSNFHTHVLNTFAKKTSKTGPVDTHWWVRVLAEQEGASLKSDLFKVGHGWTCK